MPQARLQLFCPAKINLALSVGAPSPDRAGLHPIASWMAAVDFGDTLTLTRTPGPQSTFDLAFSPEGPRPQSVDWPIEKDLCFRAHRLLEAHTGRPLPVALTLGKRVPAGAGMGGGSSDAAFTLTGLKDLFGLGLSDDTLCQLAATLGSDIPFFIHVARGRPAALVTEVGNCIEPLPPRPAISLVLVFPPFGTPTGPVYHAFDQTLSPGQAADLPRVRALTSQIPLASDAPFNDLADPACHVVPALRQARLAAQHAARRPVHITGSGSTLFTIATNPHDAQTLAQTIRADTGLATLPTHTL